MVGWKKDLPIATELGATDEQLDAIFLPNKEKLKDNLASESLEKYLQLASLISEAGSLINTGGPEIIASSYGLTYTQAVEWGTEIENCLFLRKDSGDLD